MDDRTAIIDLTIRYCWALDDREWDALDDVFAPDASAHLGGIDCADRSAIGSRCRSALDRLDASHHMVANHRVEVSGDAAASWCYLQAQHTRRGAPDGDNWLVGGRYRDRLTRTGDGWRIVRRDLEILWSEGNLGVFQA